MMLQRSRLGVGQVFLGGCLIVIIDCQPSLPGQNILSRKEANGCRSGGCLRPPLAQGHRPRSAASALPIRQLRRTALKAADAVRYKPELIE
jgi:hypothetical protein